jgi:hypothetical protein
VNRKKTTQVKKRLGIVSVIATLSAGNAGAVVINEIMQNPSAVSDSNGEWFELFNPGATDIDINGWTISDNDFDSHVINNGGALVVSAGGYLVLGRNASSGTNGGVSVDYSYGSGFFLANGADELVVSNGSAVEQDRVEWDGGPAFPDPTGASMALLSPALDNNVGANWLTSTSPFGAGDLGTPGAANFPGFVSPGDVVINEIMQNPSAVSDSQGEWFELFNPTAGDIDINGWTIADNDIDSHTIDNGGALVIPAGGYLVLGRNADTATNGGVDVDYVYTGLALANGDDELLLIDDIISQVIDIVEWDGGTAFPDPNGASMALRDPVFDNNDGANWTTSTAAFGAGDLGTPGARNFAPSGPTLPIPMPLALIGIGLVGMAWRRR